MPQPQRFSATAERYALPPGVTITATGSASALASEARRILREHATGAALTLSTAANDRELGSEGYHLRISSSGITVTANAPAGVYYGLQTLDQLLPAPFAGSELEGVDVVDWPHYRWRGIHLDVSRHFFGVPVVERFIDVAAHYKLNVFHWHLTDDQGWRIAIARYPRLTSIGGCRAGTEMEGDATEIDAKRYCGYYTQAQIRAVVAYARERFVTIVPEIEMPGHSQAAIAAYPELSCDPSDRYGVRETWGVSTVIYCPTETTFAFLENVLREVIALFPGTYVHIGGDEVPTTAWERSPAVAAMMRSRHISSYRGVQAYFDWRIERFLQSHGRRAIGWDDVLGGNVTDQTAIMVWHADTAGDHAARSGRDAVMTPDGPLYFDAYQGDPDDEPQAIGSLSTPEMVYGYRPPAGAPKVIGVQGNVWSEYIATSGYLFYMLLPRMLSLSEIAWRDPQPRRWDTFETRMGAQLAWLATHGYNFRIPNPEFSVNGGALHFASVTSSVRTVTASVRPGPVTIALSAIVPGATIRYTTDGSDPSAHSATYTQPLAITLGSGDIVDVRAVVQMQGGRTSTPSELVLQADSGGANAP